MKVINSCSSVKLRHFWIWNRFRG